MDKRAKVLCATLMLALATFANAAVRSSTGTVAFIYAYGDFGGGDFTFKLSTQPSGCPDGFWIAKSQPGFSTTVALVLQAKATGDAIYVGGEDTQLWPGSSTGAFCKLNYVGFPQ